MFNFKKGQITIFIIIGILIISSFLLISSFNGKNNSEFGLEDYNLEIRPIKEFVEVCIQKEIKEALFNSGYSNLNELENIINYNLKVCVDDFNQFKEFKVEQGLIVSQIKLTEGDRQINVDVDFPLILKKEGKTTNFNVFNINTPLATKVNLNYDSNNLTIKDYYIIPSIGKCELKILKGTNATINGETINNITLKVIDKSGFKSPNKHIIGQLVYLLEPSGAEFSPPLEFKCNYGGDELYSYIDENDIMVGYYSGYFLSWKEYPSNVNINNNEIIGNISHFTVIAPLVDDTNSTPVYTESGCKSTPFICGNDQWCTNICSGTNVVSSCPDGYLNCDCYGSCVSPSSNPEACKASCALYDVPYGEEGDGAGDYSCNKVINGTNENKGFFSLKSFNGQLYAGAFAYHKESDSMVYNMNGKVVPGILDVGESVCEFEEFNEYLYAGVEFNRIKRSKDGINWEEVYYPKDGYNTVCGMAVFKNNIYVTVADITGKSYILRSSTGDSGSWKKVKSTNTYLREVTVFNDKLYAFGLDVGSKKKYILISSDGTNWQSKEISDRVLRGNVINNTFWLGTSTRSTKSSAAKLLKFDGGSNFEDSYSSTSYETIMTVKEWKGNIFAATSTAFKDGKSSAKLLYSIDNGVTWKTACVVDEMSIWDIELHEDKLYIATLSYDSTSSGNVYEVTGGPKLTDPSKATEVLRWHDYTNGDRPTWYGSKKMDEYPETFIIDVPECETTFDVQNNGERFEYSGANNWVLKVSEMSERGMGIIGPTSCRTEIAYLI